MVVVVIILSNYTFAAFEQLLEEIILPIKAAAKFRLLSEKLRWFVCSF